MEKTRLLLSAVPLTIQAAQGEGDKLPTFEMLAYTGSKIQVGWQHPCIIDLAGLAIPSQTLPIRLQHEALLGVGHTTEVAVDGAKLVAKGIISRDTSAARDVAKSGKNGYPWQASVGVSVTDYEFAREGQSVTVNGQSVDGPLYVIRASELDEISFVDLGADRNTSATVKAQQMEKEQMEKTVEEVRAERAPAVQTVKAEASDRRVIEAALVMSAGSKRAEKHYDAKTLEAADKFRGMGPGELLYIVARQNGYTGRPGDVKAMFDHALRVQAQDWSSNDFTGILGNVANKFLMDGFYSVEDSWRAIAATRSVPDFKQATVYRGHYGTQFEEVAATGTIPHGSGLQETVATVTAATYGKMLAITRQDLINDDLGVFSDAARALGRGAGLSINDTAWTLWLGNASSGMFSVANANYAEGTSTALGIDALDAATIKFAQFVDLHGKPVAITPTTLLVPPELVGTATQIIKSPELRDTTTSKKYGVANPMFDRYNVVSSVYLSNSNYTGNSAKAWYLVANPSDVPALIVAFLNGRDVPTVEAGQTDFNTLGIQYRGFIDYGVCYGDKRAAVKMKGEA